MIELTEKNKILTVDQDNISSMIFEIRGNQVMLDRDLANLYNCKNGTKTINQAVKRHINKFPERFCFQLTDEEIKYLLHSLRSQFGTLEDSIENSKINKRGRHFKYNPYVFTEQGVAMLATVLRTAVADEISIAIMDAFVNIRKYFADSFLERKYINNQVLKNAEDIKKLQESFKKFEEKKIINEIYFDGQIYDAYSKILDIVNEAKNELIIIDRFSDKNVLDIIRNLNCKVILISQKSIELSKNISKYNQQYKNLKVIYNGKFHDRYFILDKNKIYHCGTSINYAGNKTFSINVLEDELLKKSLIEKVNEIIIK